MSGLPERERLPGVSGRVNRRPSRATPAPDGEDRLAELQRAVGNAGMRRLIDGATARAIEEAEGGGSSLAEVPAGRAAARSLASRGTPAADSLEETEALADARIHADQRAAELGARLGAQAFTIGRDVFIGPDGPGLESPEGQAMLRHELTHVLQQRSRAPGRPRRVSDPGSPAEQEAGRAASLLRTGSEERGAAGSVQRQVGEEESEEDELGLLAAETVHRQVAVEEEEEMEAATEEAATAGTPATPEPATAVPAPEAVNPALAALFDFSVGDRVAAASQALQAAPPQPREAFDALREAIQASQALARTYSQSDPELMLELSSFANGLNVAREMLAPLVGLTRSVEGILSIVSDAGPRVTAIRGRLH